MARRLALKRAHGTSAGTWAARVARSVLAGYVRFPGQDHFDAFHRRTIGMARRARPHAWAGPALVVNASAVPSTWAGRLLGPVEFVHVEGEHSAILREPLVAEVAAALSSALGATVVTSAPPEREPARQ